jgi:glucokinase
LESFQDKTVVLAGDVGGTKTMLGLFSKGTKRPATLAVETYPSKEAPDLESILERFLALHPLPLKSACFGVAGPVTDGRSKVTNLPWDLSETRLKERFYWPHVSLINDLTALALAVPLLSAPEFSSLNEGKSAPKRNIALIAPGTGLGEALLVYHNGRHIPVASEGGHTSFAPNNEAEVRLWRYLNERFGHVSKERVLSGPGLFNIYSWLKESGRFEEPAWLTKSIQEQDPAQAISEAAISSAHPLCVETLEVFVSILGAIAGDLALTGMAMGGVYLGGGIPAKILPKLKGPGLMRAFTNKGRFGDLLARVPARVILNEKANLLGSAHCALERALGSVGGTNLPGSSASKGETKK